GAVSVFRHARLILAPSEGAAADDVGLCRTCRDAVAVRDLIRATAEAADLNVVLDLAPHPRSECVERQSADWRVGNRTIDAPFGHCAEIAEYRLVQLWIEGLRLAGL